MDHSSPHVEVEVTFLRSEDGGRTTPAYSGYRPQLYYNGMDWDGEHRFVGVEQVNAGDTVTSQVRLMSPEFHVGRLEVGTRISLREGRRFVAHGRVTRILALAEVMPTQEAVTATVLKAAKVDRKKPVQIYTAPLQPIDADWVGIIRILWCRDNVPKGREHFTLTFFSPEGEEITYNSCDTVDIAMDQGKQVAGIDRNEWRSCNFVVRDGQLVTWNEIVRNCCM